MYNSLSFSLELTANSEGEEALYTVPYRRIAIKRVRVTFQSGSKGYVSLALKYGDAKVAPVSGYWYSNDGTLVEDLDLKYFLGDRVVLWWKNTNTSTSFTIIGDLEFEVEEV